MSPSCPSVVLTSWRCLWALDPPVSGTCSPKPVLRRLPSSSLVTCPPASLCLQAHLDVHGMWSQNAAFEHHALPNVQCWL